MLSLSLFTKLGIHNMTQCDSEIELTNNSRRSRNYDNRGTTSFLDESPINSTLLN